MWSTWKSLYNSCLDRHAPIRNKRIGKKKSPWITADLKRKMHNRDWAKKKAIETNDKLWWDQYKRARNQTNNAVRNAKRKYCTDNLDSFKNDPRKTWKLINELSWHVVSKSLMTYTRSYLMTGKLTVHLNCPKLLIGTSLMWGNYWLIKFLKLKMNPRSI